jgi:small subunit ribosomal protein S1
MNQTNPFNETSNQKRPSPFAALLESALDYIRPRRGEVREVSILAIGDNDMIVDLDGKRDGIITPSDLDNVSEEYVETLSVGDKVPVQIIKESSRANGIVVSLKKGLEQQDWIRAEKMLDSGDTFEAEVTDVNRGGVLVNFGRLQAFVPNSHLTSVPMGLKRDAFREAKEELVGKTLTLSVIEVKQRRRRLIASERAARKQKREQLLQELAEGDIRTGLVRNIVDFGVFVDLGGIDGLIHISELDWEYVKDPNNVLSVGEEVEVYVLNVDRERERIALSRKRVIPVSHAE